MESFTHVELTRTLDRWSGCGFNEVELLFAEEARMAITFRDGTLHQRSYSGNSSLMLTALRSGFVHRRSWCADDHERLRTLVGKGDASADASPAPEPAQFVLNRPAESGLPELPSMAEADMSASGELMSAVEDCAGSFHRAFPRLASTLYLESKSETRRLANTHGLAGSYRRESVRTTVVLVDRATGNRTLQRGLSLASLKEILRKCEIEGPKFGQALPGARLQGGISPVLLSPAAVALLCLRISSFLRGDLLWKTSLSGALPDGFELFDDPFLPGGSRRAPFDDEGTRTRVKRLLKGGQRIEPLSDLRVAAALGIAGTGNGFRRGSFFSHPSECVPIPSPCQLRLTPGTVSVRDILHDQEELVWIESIGMPFSQIVNTKDTRDVWSMTGKYFRGGKVMASLTETRFTGRPVVSAGPPGSHGSLLDRNSVVLAEGELLESGWYPYIFVPMVRW